MGVLSELKTKDYFTLTGTFFGFCALITGTMTDAFRGAFIFVFLSIVFDLLDGTVARKMNQVNEIGMQIDSLSDCFCFAFVPSVIMFRIYTLPTTQMGIPGYNFFILLIPAFIFSAAGLLRLAWFNISDNEGYTGLVTPLSAGFLAMFHMVDYFGFLATNGTSWFNYFMHYSLPIVMILVGWFNITDKLYYGKEVRKKQGGAKIKLLIIGILLVALIILATFFRAQSAIFIFIIFAFLLIYLIMFIITGFQNYYNLKKNA